MEIFREERGLRGQGGSAVCVGWERDRKAKGARVARVLKN
jgi:hypothetical protein